MRYWRSRILVTKKGDNILVTKKGDNTLVTKKGDNILVTKKGDNACGYAHLLLGSVLLATEYWIPSTGSQPHPDWWRPTICRTSAFDWPWTGAGSQQHRLFQLHPLAGPSRPKCLKMEHFRARVLDRSRIGASIHLVCSTPSYSPGAYLYSARWAAEARKGSQVSGLNAAAERRQQKKDPLAQLSVAPNVLLHL